MWRDVPDQIDRFPGDFAASLRLGSAAAFVCGALAWWLARAYLHQSYPKHPEMLAAAIVVGLIDGAMLGIAGFVLTYVVRVWRYERRLRKRSDETLRLTLAEMDTNGSNSSR